jgi:Tol biopolymer transport system component
MGAFSCHATILPYSIVFVTITENPILYLFNIKDQTSSALINSVDFQPGIGLAWSPDGQSIVFSCRVQNTLGLSLCLVNITNSENIRVLVKSEILGASDIVDGATSPSWSSDKQKIVFLSSSTPSSSSLGEKIVSTRDIWLFDFSTNSAKLVFSNNTEGISYIFTPVLLSEENSILFSGREDNFNTLFNYKIDSHQTQNIMFTDNSFDLVDFVLSPDRKSFLVHVPTLENSTQNFIPTLYSMDGHLLKQLNSLTNFQVISWSIQE